MRYEKGSEVWVDHHRSEIALVYTDDGQIADTFAQRSESIQVWDYKDKDGNWLASDISFPKYCKADLQRQLAKLI